MLDFEAQFVGLACLSSVGTFQVLILLLECVEFVDLAVSILLQVVDGCRELINLLNFRGIGKIEVVFLLLECA